MAITILLSHDASRETIVLPPANNLPAMLAAIRTRRFASAGDNEADALMLLDRAPANRMSGDNQ